MYVSLIEKKQPELGHEFIFLILNKYLSLVKK